MAALGKRAGRRLALCYRPSMAGELCRDCDFPEELSLCLVQMHAASRTPAVQWHSTAQRGQDSLLRNWAPRGVRDTQIQDRSDRWKHRECRSGRACESSSEKKLVLIAMLRSNVGNESLLLYQIREGRLPTSTVSLLHTRIQALAPVIVVVR